MVSMEIIYFNVAFFYSFHSPNISMVLLNIHRARQSRLAISVSLRKKQAKDKNLNAWHIKRKKKVRTTQTLSYPAYSSSFHLQWWLWFKVSGHAPLNMHVWVFICPTVGTHVLTLNYNLLFSHLVSGEVLLCKWLGRKSQRQQKRTSTFEPAVCDCGQAVEQGAKVIRPIINYFDQRAFSKAVSQWYCCKGRTEGMMSAIEW